ncbi:general stress protein [Lederbergia citrea]|uniref:General stress protein n=1 Tax=Lederbergia citrea TaxID=2833581 RepID=A0A942UM71_9BACI|nr:general stress protein [Lederbergia citrea]MBS4221837.1 general stress protein [Lederbergia citrea]
MDTSVVGVFESQQEVINEIKKYQAEGIDPKKFSVLAKDDSKIEILTEEMNVEERNPANEGAFGILGGFLAGIAGGVAVPGMSTPIGGPILAAGPIAGAFPGGSKDELKIMFSSIGIDGQTAENYINELDAGKILLFLEG